MGHSSASSSSFLNNKQKKINNFVREKPEIDITRKRVMKSKSCKWRRKLEISTSREVVRLLLCRLYIHARTDGKWVASLSSSCVCDSSSSDSKRKKKNHFLLSFSGLLLLLK